jgi:hypothetical protein
MKLDQHPEYDKYLADQAFVADVREKLTKWLDENEAAVWELETAVSSLTTLFQEYNQVMWQSFPFCQMCLGGCCVVGASEVTAVDGAVLTVLGHDLPVLPAQTSHNERACIYLGERGCTWPVNWRPLKCMIFYSLGSGKWQLASSNEDYGRLSSALQAVIDKHLPNILNDMSLIDSNEVVEPITFAKTFSNLLTEQLLPPELIEINTQPDAQNDDPISHSLMFVASMMETIFENPDGNDILLADLEQFEWIVTGMPANMTTLLTEINGRYAPTASSNPLHAQFSQQIQLFVKSLDDK